MYIYINIHVLSWIYIYICVYLLIYLIYIQEEPFLARDLQCPTSVLQEQSILRDSTGGLPDFLADDVELEDTVENTAGPALNLSYEAGKNSQKSALLLYRHVLVVNLLGSWDIWEFLIIGHMHELRYAVATISRLLKSQGLFCKRAL